MKKKALLEKINSGYLFMDGGMGTLLQGKGLGPGELPERWNLSHPEVIEDIHRAYFKAGSDIVSTNTFGANVLKFDEGELKDIVFAAVDNAKRACFNEDQFVALDIGPTGRLLEPWGELKFEEAVEIFAKTVRLGALAGADLIIIETMNDSYEMKAAVLAAKENSDLAVFATNAYEKRGKLMTGATPKAMVALLEGLGVDALGINCSLGPREMIPVVEELTKYASLPVIVNPNAGLPRVEDGKTVYDVDAESFTETMKEIAALGARILGGCCGTTPGYIKNLVDALKDVKAVPLSEKNYSLISSKSYALEFGEIPILIGERINPTGKEKLKKALTDHDMEYILDQGLKEEENGADVLDVNVGLPEIDETEMLTEAVRALQEVTNLPLAIDSSNPKALESALRSYNGKALINSINGKKEQMDQVFPLIKKYGGVVVALLLDEDGIPKTATGRLKVAQKIYDTAQKYGISRKNIILDALCMSVSTDDHSAIPTLECVRRIKDDFGGLSILGVTNISFGLPDREALDSAFFLMALNAGINAAIINPNSLSMMEAYHSFLVLKGLDKNCLKYIEFAFRSGFTGKKKTSSKENFALGSPLKGGSVPDPKEETPSVAISDFDSEGNYVEAQNHAKVIGDVLKNDIKRGLKEQAKDDTLKLLNEGVSALSIIDSYLVGALNEVGKDYEEGIIFLPQLLMSSEAAKSAFSVLRENMLKTGESRKKKGKFVIATVKGDIHDIGKNIVKSILENYDFEVFDLGKDVDPQLIVDTVIKEHAPVVGLSALMTTTVANMQGTIGLIKERAPWCQVIVGGAVLTQKYADMIGADFYAKDAMDTVHIAERIMEESE